MDIPPATPPTMTTLLGSGSDLNKVRSMASYSSSGEDDLTTGGHLVELADGDDVHHLVDQIVLWSVANRSTDALQA